MVIFPRNEGITQGLSDYTARGMTGTKSDKTDLPWRKKTEEQLLFQLWSGSWSGKNRSKHRASDTTFQVKLQWHSWNPFLLSLLTDGGGYDGHRSQKIQEVLVCLFNF